VSHACTLSAGDEVCLTPSFPSFLVFSFLFAQLISEELGYKLENIQAEQLGSAKKVSHPAQHSTVQYSTAQYSAVPYSTPQYIYRVKPWCTPRIPWACFALVHWAYLGA